MPCGGYVRPVLIWSVGLVLHVLIATELAATDIFCDGVKVGEVSFGEAVSPGGRPGVTGGFTAADTDGDGDASLAEAATKCHEDHFNWFQTASGTHPLINGGWPPPNSGGPQVDPKAGGNDPPNDWADDLPWYWDEGADPPAGTAGFEDGYHVNDHTQDQNGDGTDDFLNFEDFPAGPDGTSVTFHTWLVSLNADGSLHSFHDGGIGWSYQNPTDGPPTRSIDFSFASPTFGLQEWLLYDGPLHGFDNSVTEQGTDNLPGDYDNDHLVARVI